MEMEAHLSSYDHHHKKVRGRWPNGKLGWFSSGAAHGTLPIWDPLLQILPMLVRTTAPCPLSKLSLRPFQKAKLAVSDGLHHKIALSCVAAAG